MNLSPTNPPLTPPGRGTGKAFWFNSLQPARITAALEPTGRCAASDPITRTAVQPMMKHFYAAGLLQAFLIFGLLLGGCATRNVNPTQAKANTGYVDFHADSSSDLSWDVARFDERSQVFQSIFSELEPPQNGALRLAFPPGHCRLRVTFLNRVIAKPAEIEVEVRDGKITPVRVTLTAAGASQVRTEEESRGGRARGSYGRRVKVGSVETAMYNVSAVADPPVAYQTKERKSDAR